MSLFRYIVIFFFAVNIVSCVDLQKELDQGQDNLSDESETSETVQTDTDEEVVDEDQDVDEDAADDVEEQDDQGENENVEDENDDDDNGELCQKLSDTDLTCDGVDDDCDNLVDEDYVSVNTNCGTGFCVAIGTTSCVDGQVVDLCIAGAPASDTNCNNIDDDCDGQVDEGYVPQITSCGVGACAASGTTSCSNGQIINSCIAGAPASDTNCNNIDDDCDGNKDEHYQSQQTSCGVGDCLRDGNTSCVNGNIQDSCVAGPPAVEVCDAVDNDCDSSTDENLSDQDNDSICDDLDFDNDNDGIPDPDDNCPLVANANQEDNDNDGVGDACDTENDSDLDGIADNIDNCPDIPNTNQLDLDNDGIGYLCDDDIANYFDYCGDEAVFADEEQVTITASAVDEANHKLLVPIELNVSGDIDLSTIVKEAIWLRAGNDFADFTLDVDTVEGTLSLVLEAGANGLRAWNPSTQYKIKLCHHIKTNDGTPIKPIEIVVQTRVPNQQEDIGLTHSNGTRSGVFYLPGGYDPTKTYPLAVMLHGLNGNGSSYVSQLQSLADDRKVILLGPDGFARANAFGDGSTYYFNPNHVNNVVQDYTFIMNCVDKILDAFPIDESQVLLAGISMGAPATLFVAGESDIFTHAAMLHGIRLNYDPGKANDVNNLVVFFVYETEWEESPLGTNRPDFWMSTSTDDWVTNYDNVPINHYQFTYDRDIQYVSSAHGNNLTVKRCYPGGHVVNDPEKAELFDWFLDGISPTPCP